MRLRSALLLLALAAPAAAQTIPSPRDVLGYDLGDDFTPYAGVARYARALADASPNVELRVYGRTPEGRELLHLVIARPDHLARLDEILARLAELAQPDTPPERARQIAATTPALVLFSYGVHGNEASSTEAALWTAYDLARGAPETAGILDSLVVILDPVTNPDGRERYVQWFRSVVGPRPDPQPWAREHREPWPGGRYNHFLFDLNRDWAWATQPETRARLAAWARWTPQVHVDFHEMDYNSTYFFFPAAPPINPLYPPHILAWGRRFGAGNAAAFDARGWAYYTGEAFDLFYPGYGDSWPSLLGAVGMTYEQAGHGAAGLAILREDGDTLTLRQRAEHHRVAGLATLRTAAAAKTQLLLDFAAGQRTVGLNEPDVLLVPGDDPSRLARLVALLRLQGIAAEVATRPFRAAAQPYPGFSARRDFPAGTVRVRLRQPRGRLAQTLLQAETPLRAEYSYDISAWSLPYAYGVEAHRSARPPEAGWRPAEPASARVVPPPAALGYLVPPDAESLPGIVALLRRQVRVRALGAPVRLGGRAWPAGTWFVPATGATRDSLPRWLADAGLGARAVPIASGRSDEGIDLGSEQTRTLRLPRVALVSGEGIAPTSLGALWVYLDQELGLPVHLVNANDLARALPAAELDVVVLPDAFGLPAGAREALERWVQEGGRLVAIAGGADLVAELAGAKRRPEPADTARAHLLAGRRERERLEWERQIPGTVLAVRLDPAHPLAWGASSPGDSTRLFVLHQEGRVFEPAPGLEAVAYFPAEVRRLSGVIAPQRLRFLANGVWLAAARKGRGSVVLFADDPAFRLFWRGTLPLLARAVLVGP